MEVEADRVAEQILAVPLRSAVAGASPRIQRRVAQAVEQAHTAPASVDRVLASSGAPLNQTLQQDMGQRFRYDFSRVRVHSGSAAEQSAREINANAYTVGDNIVFGAGRFDTETHDGRRLIAHELTHVVQQSPAEKSNAGQAIMASDGVSGASPRTSSDIQRRQPAVTRYSLMLARSPNPQTGWWGEKAAVIRAAIRTKKFATYPDGAYWIINPLNDADRATIMSHLDRGDLEQLLAHRTDAAESVPNAKDIADKAGRALDGALPKGTTWWGQKIESIRSAITNSKNFTIYPDGAFWLINPLNDNDRAHIVTLLAREDLESLFARGAEAMAAGIPHAVDIVARATDELHRRGFVPETGNTPAEPLPESGETDYTKNPAYVDNIASAHFDVESGRFWATHVNGATVPLNLNEILTDSDRGNFPPHVRAGEPRHAMLQYFFRDPAGLIRSSLYSIALTPNIVDCARQVREALPQASAMRSIGLTLLEMQKTSLQAAIAGKAVGAVGGRIFARVWRARGLQGGTGAIPEGKGAEVTPQSPAPVGRGPEVTPELAPRTPAAKPTPGVTVPPQSGGPIAGAASKGGGVPGAGEAAVGGGGTPKQTHKASGRVESGGSGNKPASAKAAGVEEAAAAGSPLTAEQQKIAQSLLAEHPHLHPTVAKDATKGSASVAGKGGAGADVPLLNGGGRELSVHQSSSPFTAESIGSHLQAKAMQSGTTEIYLQINSGSREGFLKMLPDIRNAYLELRGVSVKIYGPDGAVWWTGRFGGPT